MVFGAVPARLGWQAPALAVPLAAMAWTLPLQLLHFGSAPLYALLANLLAAPLLAPLTLSARGLARESMQLPAATRARSAPTSRSSSGYVFECGARRPSSV